MRCRSVIPALLLAAPAIAAEDGTGDVRLLLGTYAGVDRVAVHDRGGNTLSDHLIGDSIGRGLELDYVRAPGTQAVGYYAQAGVAARYARGDDAEGTRHVYAGGGLAGFGLCLRPLPELQFELGPTVTVGLFHYQGATSDDLYAYFSGDLRAGMWWTIDRWQIGGVAGVAAHLASIDTTRNDGSELKTDYSGNGGFVLVGLGFRL